MRIQTIDLILPPNVLAKYMQFARPFLDKKPHFDNSFRASRSTPSPFASITNLRNDRLPLIYFEFKGIRVMLPVASESLKEFQHDLLMLQVSIDSLVKMIQIFNMNFVVVGWHSNNSASRKSNMQITVATRHLSIGCTSKYFKCTWFGSRGSTVPD